MDFLQKINVTPFVFDFGPCLDKDGQEYVVAALKATFRFSDNGKLSIPDREEMLPVFPCDLFNDKPDNSSVKYPADIVFSKSGTDVIINGHAYNGRQGVNDIAFQAGPVEKAIRVFGPRYWDIALLGARMTEPEPFDRMPLAYENAYGGACEDEKAGKRVYEFNPVGAGFALTWRDGLAAPNLEYPRELIKSIKDRPRPASFGAVAPGWAQRTRYAGTFDASWSKTRQPLLPLDFDERFHHAVPEDQIVNSRLRGGEPVVLINMHPRKARMEWVLPTYKFKTLFRVKNRVEEIPMVIDTLLIEPDENRFALTFRSTCAIGNDFQYVKSVTVKSAS